MAVLPLLLALLLPGCRAAGDLPNIIHIMGDDVGWNDLGYHNDLITSPWIDKLALGGVRLTNHHAFKVCAPSRSGFHTGRLPWQMGYYDNSGAATPWETVDSNKLGADPRFKLLTLHAPSACLLSVHRRKEGVRGPGAQHVTESARL